MADMYMGAVMSAKDALELNFRKLVMEMPYEKVTIAEICRRAHLSRKTFYANFQDKEDIVSSIFEHDVVEPMRVINRTLTMEQTRGMTQTFTENIYARLFIERDYYKALVGSQLDRNDVFRRVATQCIYTLNREILESKFNVPATERDYAAYFFAESQAAFCEKWIIDGMPMSAQELALMYGKFMQSYWLTLELKEQA